MSPRIISAFSRDAHQRHRDHGAPVRIGGEEGQGIYNSARWAQYLREGGFLGEHDAVLRLQKAAWPLLTSRKRVYDAEIELWLNEAWVSFKVAAVTDLALSSEWKIQLEARVG